MSTLKVNFDFESYLKIKLFGMCNVTGLVAATDYKGTSNVIKERLSLPRPHPLTIWARPPLENLSPPMVSVGFAA